MALPARCRQMHIATGSLILIYTMKLVDVRERQLGDTSNTAFHSHTCCLVIASTAPG